MHFYRRNFTKDFYKGISQCIFTEGILQRNFTKEFYKTNFEKGISLSF